MSESLLIAGIVCIVGAIVGGGIKLLGAEVPVLNSFGRQALLFVVGLAFLFASFQIAGPKPAPPAPTRPASGPGGEPPPQSGAAAQTGCPEAQALSCLPSSSGPVTFADPAAANAAAAINVRNGLSTSRAEADAVRDGATGRAARLCGIVGSSDSSPLGMHDAAVRLNSLAPADGRPTPDCLKTATAFL